LLQVTRELHENSVPKQTELWDDKQSPVWNAFSLALTYNSCAIEGCQLSEGETRQVMERHAEVRAARVDPNTDNFESRLSVQLGISETPTGLIKVGPAEVDVFSSLTADGMPIDDVAMVVDHSSALDFVRANMIGKPITTDLIIDVNRLVMRNTAAIEATRVYGLAADHAYRGLPVQITGSPVVCPFPQELPAIMDKLVSQYNALVDVDPILAAIVFKMCFLQVHPFADGNGRTARLVLNAMLHNAGLFGCVIRVQDRQQYLSFFADFDDHGHVDDLQAFMLGRIQQYTRAIQAYHTPDAGVVVRF